MSGWYPLNRDPEWEARTAGLAPIWSCGSAAASRTSPGWQLADDGKTPLPQKEVKQ